MKKLLVAILMVLALGGSLAYASGSSRAASYQGNSSGSITGNSPVVIDTRGGLIYNITLNATSALATLSVYDSSTGGTMTEQPVYEVEVAVAGDSRSVDMNAAPLNTYQGITVSVTNGVGYLNDQL